MHWQQKLKHNAMVVQRVADTAHGKEFFALINEVFNHVELIGADTHDTYYRLGQRDVVEYLNQLLEARIINE